VSSFRTMALAVLAAVASPAAAQTTPPATGHPSGGAEGNDSRRGSLGFAQASSSREVRNPSEGSEVDSRTPEQLRKEVIERMRALRAYKIVEELKLDENASARLFPVLAKFDEREMVLAAQRRDIIRELREQVESSHPDDGRIGKAIERLLANRARRHELRDEQIKEVRRVLTPVQQAKLVLLLPRLERDFAQWVHESSGRD
jgi:Spy/CpxP family protein refolding chaperone